MVQKICKLGHSPKVYCVLLITALYASLHPSPTLACARLQPLTLQIGLDYYYCTPLPILRTSNNNDNNQHVTDPFWLLRQLQLHLGPQAVGLGIPTGALTKT